MTEQIEKAIGLLENLAEENVVKWRSTPDKKIGDDLTQEEQLVRIALSALREYSERHNPKALTVDELRERGGKPVWIQRIRFGEWKILNTYKPVDERKMYYNDDKSFDFLADMGKTWACYDYPPEGEV